VLINRDCIFIVEYNISFRAGKIVHIGFIILFNRVVTGHFTFKTSNSFCKYNIDADAYTRIHLILLI
jgi:hypothetical protein